MLLIPLKDDNPTGKFPIVTVIIIALNCLIFFYQKLLPAEMQFYFTVQYGYIPYELTHAAELTPQMPFSTWLTPFTSMFMHADYAHIAGNMLYLWIFGNNVEDFLGRARFVIFYIFAGLAAIALFTAVDFDGTTPLVGASGAIAGVMGAYFVVWPRARVMVLFWFIFFVRLFWLPAVFVLGAWIALQIIMGMATVGGPQMGGVAWFAHIGGFAYGYIFLRLAARHRTKTKRGRVV
ncbi:MAG: rhomboid family intramembrane serine protease [Candidatus Zixiibacteriota bacterium]